MSLARDLIDAALQADLSQNELRVFLVLFRQTLCYGKTHDPLTLKRLASLSHIRKDRLPIALAKVLACGLFSAQPHQVFEQEYQIHADFLHKQADHIYAPALPKNRKLPPKTEAVSENREHTINTITIIPPNNNPHDQTLNFPASFDTQTRAAAQRLLNGLNPSDAQACLDILQQRLQTGRVHSPLAYLYQLAQAARQQRLDCSRLHDAAPKPQSPSKPEPSVYSRLQNLTAQIQGLDQLYALAQTPLDAISAQQRQAWVKEYQHLCQQLNGAIGSAPLP
jgi:hypothetical protein